MTSIDASSGGSAPLAPAPPSQPLIGSKKNPIFGSDVALASLARLSGLCIIFMLGALLVVLFISALPSIRQYGWKFLVTSEWRPNELQRPVRDANGKLMYDTDGEVVMEEIPPEFGALPVIYGTAVSSALALLFSVPLSLAAAIFLVRAAPAKLVPPVSFLIEFLAAIPSIAYGLWGLFVLVPILAKIELRLERTFGHVGILSWLFTDHLLIGGKVVERQLAVSGSDMLCGGLVLAVMILPIITAISRDILRQVPRAQIEGSVALGATWWESCKEMLKYSRSGLFGAVMLGLARAAGETMAITMVIGNNPQIRASIFAPAQTMSSLLANQFSEASTELHRAALCEVALVLLVMSLLFNVVARWLVVGKESRSGRAA